MSAVLLVYIKIAFDFYNYVIPCMHCHDALCYYSNRAALNLYEKTLQFKYVNLVLSLCACTYVHMCVVILPEEILEGLL